MRRRIAPLLLTIASLLALATPDWCAAQGGVVADVEGGPAWLREAAIPQTAVGTIGASLRAASRQTGVAASSLGACSADHRCTLQGVVTGAAYAPAAARLRWETSLTGSAFALDGGLPVSSIVMGFREYLGGAERGVFAGANGGFLRSGITRGAAALETGGWWRVRAGRVSAGARLTRAPIVSVDSGAPAPLTGRMRSLGDLWTGWQHDAAPLSITAAVGWRIAPGASGVGGGWATLEATRWLTPRLAVVGAVGRALEDPTRGIPAVRYANLSLRLRLHAPEPMLRPPAIRQGPVVTVVAEDDSMRRLEVRVPHAATVELIADFTDWNPVALARDGERWFLVSPIAPGPHRLALRIDGGEWQAPANLPIVQDEFGGTAGLITVP